jgi:hypothetical protein
MVPKRGGDDDGGGGGQGGGDVVLTLEEEQDGAVPGCGSEGQADGVVPRRGDGVEVKELRLRFKGRVG